MPRGGARYPSTVTQRLHRYGVQSADVAKLAGYRPTTGGSILSGHKHPEAPERWARALRLLLPSEVANEIIYELGFDRVAEESLL